MKNPPTILHDNARPHTAKVVTFVWSMGLGSAVPSTIIHRLKPLRLRLKPEDEGTIS
ncbi:hypothetical protein C0J52_21248 [Blattella germanica]|nr:hypothetical protein C0J52_21248 [Blattella germanica]